MSLRPYAPSWIDRVIDWIDRLPGPAVLFYLGLYLSQVVFYHLAIWIDGVAPVGELSPEMIAAGLWIVLGLGAIHLFERATRRALRSFEPAFGNGGTAFDDLEYRMTEMPFVPVLVLTVVPAVLITASVLSEPSYVYEGLQSPISMALTIPGVVFSWSLAPVLFYVVGRTLVMVRRAYREIPEIDLLRQRPLYALSNLTMRVGLFMLVLANINLGTYFLSGGTSTGGLDLILGIAGVVVALATFIMPLWGIHQRLQDAKATRLEENAVAVDRTRVQLYRALEDEDHDRVESLDRGLASLVRVEERLGSIPTWPWQPGTFRNFSTAVVLPIVVWLSQQALSDLF